MRIGLLGASTIAPKAIVEPAELLPDVQVAAVAARDSGRARAFAERYNIPKVHTDYVELLGDETLDAVYVGLPISYHAEWAVAALRAGRHVLCEKPLAANAEQAVEMVGAARDARRCLMEGMHWRYHPLADRMLELARRIGRVERAECRFDAIVPRPNIRFDLNLGGGVTMDFGCYPVHWLRTVAGEEPVVVRAVASEDPPGVDSDMDAELAFPSGLEARIRCSMTRQVGGFPESIYLHLEGSRGTLDVANPMMPQVGHRVTAKLEDGTCVDESVDMRPTYFFQLQAFVDTVTRGKDLLTNGEDSIANMRVLDAIYVAAQLPPRG
jgi:predicted dehydrogenase